MSLSSRRRRATKQNSVPRNTRLSCESLEERQLLAADVGVLDALEVAHGPGCSCPGCCSQGDPIMLGDGHYIGDGHNHTESDALEPPKWWDDAPRVYPRSTGPLTIILDFNDPSQGNTSETDVNGSPNVVGTWDHTEFSTFFGVDPNRGQIEQGVLATVRSHFDDVPRNTAASFIPDNYRLNIQFEIGNIGTPPTNGSGNYYYIQIGEYVSGQSSSGLGVAWTSGVRTSSGAMGYIPIGGVFGTVFTGRLADVCPTTLGSCDWAQEEAILSIANTVSHEIGHGLSLEHVAVAGSTTMNGLTPIMSTGDIDRPNSSFWAPNEFATIGTASELPGMPSQESAFQLTEAVGLIDPDTNDQISEAVGVSFGTRSGFSISPAADVDLFRFEVSTTDQSVGFDIDRVNGELQSFLRLFDSSGNFLASNNLIGGPMPEPYFFDAYLEYQFATPGTYYIGVSDDSNVDYDINTGLGDRDAGGRTGDYLLHVIDLDNISVSTLDDTANNDFNVISLREAIDIANGTSADTITFSTGLSGGTITLGGSDLVIDESLNIDASMLNNPLTIDANDQSRIFDFRASEAGEFFDLENLILTGGNVSGFSGYGGAIWNSFGELNLKDVTVTGNSSDWGGGILSVVGNVTLDNSTVTNNSGGIGGGIGKNFGTVTLNNNSVVSNNTAAFDGGGIGIVIGGGVVVNDSTISGNSAVEVGGGIANGYGVVTINNSTISGNTGAQGGGGIYTTSAPITLTNSYVNNNRYSDMLAGSGDGGGIFTVDGDVTLHNTIMQSNFGWDGGAIAVRNGDVKLYDSDLSNNSVSNRGGAVYVRTGDLRVERTTISGNTADGPGGDTNGGGVYSLEGRVDVVDSDISGNSAINSGGGIWSGGELVIQSSTVADNTADGTGGGINVEGGILTASQSTVSGNTSNVTSSYTGGGGIYLLDSMATITDSLIAGNEATANEGGGIRARYATDLTVSNTTISGNSSDGVGAGISAADGTVSVNLQSTTLANNTGNRGALFMFGSQASLSVTNSIVADNIATTTSAADVDLNGGFVRTFSYSLIEDPRSSIAGASNITGVDPMLDGLADNGGSTLTHALLPGSPAINAGDPNVAMPPAFDQRGAGFDRVVGGQIDMGAFELQTIIIDPDFNDDGNIDGVDIDLLQANLVNGPLDPATFDLDGDGQVTIADRNEWLVQAGAANLPSGNAYLLGDANLDGVVDGQDFIEWNNNKFTSTSAWTGGDFNADGVVDGQDFIEWNNNKFQAADLTGSNRPQSSPAVDPERFRDALFAQLHDADSE